MRTCITAAVGGSFMALCGLVLGGSGIGVAHAQPPAPVSAPVAGSDPFALPAVEEGLPGEGPLRRYAGYVQGWKSRREAWSKRIAADHGAVVFLGDSITQGFGDDFRGRFAGMKLANRGISGDTTRGMLIRLEADVLSLDPAAVVILAGTNDIEVGIEPEAIARNVAKIVAAIKAHDVATQAHDATTGGTPTPIILCRVLPSAAVKHRPAETIRRLNGLVDAAVKGDPQITVLDTWTLFADPAGDSLPDYFPDRLHLNPAGYDRWAAAIRPLFATLGFIDTEPDRFVAEEGFESLFNGRDLSGWGFRPTPPRKPQPNPKPNAPAWVAIEKPESFAGKTASPDGRYVAINGRLVVTTPAEGRRIQQLWTTGEYDGDFVLRLEFRATPNADSGVFIRQPQLQCRDFALAGPWKELKQYRPQDWNALEVTVTDGVARAACNGEPIPGEMKVPPSGPIGLEGDRGQMEYRRIRLKRLARPVATPAAAAARPNVILFIFDDVSSDDLGCYGGAAARTPHIDALAASGRRFDNAFLTASSCSPSRSSIITGRYPHNLGKASELHEPIAAHLPWFPRLLREAGYYTALVGKHHMTSEKPAAGTAAQPPAFDLVTVNRHATVAGNRGGHASWVTTVRDRPRDRPFCFWFAGIDAHRGWDGDGEWREDLYGPKHDPATGRVPPFLVDDAATRADLASHRNEITRFDHHVGAVVAELRSQGILDDTLIIVMADNGRPFPRAKTRLHDSGMKTPFVVHWPRGVNRPGVPTRSLVSAIDIAPTILAAAGLPPADTMQGVSFLPVLGEPEAVVRTVAFSEHNWHDYEAHGRAVRTGGWLYIRNRRPALPWQGPADSVRSASHRSLLAARDARHLTPAQADVFLAPRPEEELYDTATDPDQLRNLAADPARAADLARLRGLLDAWTDATHDSAPDDLSRDEHDRETGLQLPGMKGAAFRGTPAGADRDAMHVNAPGPR